MPDHVKTSTRGFTLVELLVVLAITGVLASLLLPALARAKFSGRNTVCKSNLRQLGIALNAYSTSHDAYPVSGEGGPTEITPEFARATYWWDRLGLPGTADLGYNGKGELPGIFRCPFQKPVKIKALTGTANGTIELIDLDIYPLSSYGYNGWGSSDYRDGLGLGGLRKTMIGPPEISATKDGSIVAPADMIAFGDGFQRASAPLNAAQVTGWMAVFSPWHADEFASLPTFRAHRAKLNRVFCDGHVEPVEMDKRFVPTDAELSRWNRDNLPHRETWNNQ